MALAVVAPGDAGMILAMLVGTPLQHRGTTRPTVPPITSCHCLKAFPCLGTQGDLRAGCLCCAQSRWPALQAQPVAAMDPFGTTPLSLISKDLVF